jgi:tRNA pseudouridine38-40 synthase
MARYQVILAYDGTNFFGFQRQGGDRTVQVEVEKALRKLGWEGKTILAAGRTDSGVHANGQVIAFDLDWKHTNEELLQALNANLSSDVAAREVNEVSLHFHPRFDACKRTYRYSVFCSPNRDPLRERYAWRVWPAAEIALLEKACLLLVGRHDFAGFGRATSPNGSTVRIVCHSHWEKGPEGFLYEISANAFLYHMVRRLVFAQVKIAQGELDLADFETGIREARTMVQGLAPPQGLTLYKVFYDLGQLKNEERLEE